MEKMSWTDSTMEKMSRADLNSSGHIDNNGKGILIIGVVPAQGLDDTTSGAEVKCPINFA